MIQIDKELTGVVQGIQHHHPLLVFRKLLLERLFGTGEGIALHLGEMIDDMDISDVTLSEQTVAFLVFPRSQHIEFIFPITNHGSVDAKHLGHFANAVIVLFQFVLFHSFNPKLMKALPLVSK